jgi:rhodanese-related sulfurtransferase
LMDDLLHNGKAGIAATLHKAFREAVILFIIVVIVAVVFNMLRPSGTSLAGFSSTILLKKQQANIPVITISAAYDLYLKKKVVFVDARDPFSFEEGHIAGAVNIYPDEVTLQVAKLKQMVSEGSIVITYCDGPQCPLSKETAQGLQLQGVPMVKVLVNGWSLWLNAGYPVEKGKK